MSRKKLNKNMERYLTPIYCNRKSFYRKARVVSTCDGESLISYSTLVAFKNGNDDIFVRGTYSATTLAHIKEFLLQNNISCDLSKKKILDQFAFLDEGAWEIAEYELKKKIESGCRHEPIPILESFMVTPPKKINQKLYKIKF